MAARKPGKLVQVAAPRNRRKGDLMEANCPSRGVLEHVTSRWGVLVLLVLMEGTHRFSELRNRIGAVSEKMLSQTLRALEEDGFLTRTVYAVVPPRVEYALTPMGEQVAPHVEALAEWIEENMSRVAAARAKHAAKQASNAIKAAK